MRGGLERGRWRGDAEAGSLAPSLVKPNMQTQKQGGLMRELVFYTDKVHYLLAERQNTWYGSTHTHTHTFRNIHAWGGNTASSEPESAMPD